MRKLGAVLGLALFAVVAGASPSFAGAYVCPGVETSFLMPDNAARIIHYAANSNTTLKIGSCHHLGFVHPSHSALWVPGKSARARIAASGDCNLTPRRYDGKIATKLKAGTFAHSIHFFDDTIGVDEDIHVCVEGNVIFFEH